MNKIFFLLLLFNSTTSIAQLENQRMTFLIVIDNEYPSSDIISSKFIVEDSTNNIKDQINFEYNVGKLIMSQIDYEKLFKLKPGYKLFIKLVRRNLDLNTDYTYNAQIPKQFINDIYIIVRIYNRYDKENQVKYYFENEQTYISQIIIPGYRTILTTLKK